MAENCGTGILASNEVPTPIDPCACVGVASISFNEDGGTFTIVLTNGNTYTSPDLRGASGVQGPIGLTGPTGGTGADGAEVEMRYDSGFVQWKLVTDTVWNNLYAPFVYTNEAWKEVKTISTDHFDNGTLLPSFLPGLGQTAASRIYIRKRYNGDIEINIQASFSANFQFIDIVQIPAMVISYRPTKAQYCHIFCVNANTVLGNAKVDTSGLVTLTLPTGQTFNGGASNLCIVNASFTYSVE